MCPSSLKLYVDDFPFFGSSLAHIEPQLEMFEVWEMMVMDNKNHTIWSQHRFKKNQTYFAHFLRPAETDPYMCSWVCFNGSLNCAIPRENCHLHFPISSSHHRLQGLNVGESREMAWGQSGMARGDTSDAGSEGRDTQSCLGDTRFVKYVIRLRSNRLSVSNTIISRLSNPCLEDYWILGRF